MPTRQDWFWAHAFPIILTSRADNVRTRMASCGVALLVAHARRSGQVDGKPS